MRDQELGRVVVGVEDSLAGLRALREAVDLAQRRGTEVLAVRSYRRPSDTAVDLCCPAMSPQALTATDDLRSSLRREALAAVRRVFELAMGGVPQDVVVRAVPEDVPLHEALPATACRENDVLVVAVPARSHWWWRPGRALAGRCLDRAVCPVLVVPPPQAARELGGRWVPWRRWQRRRELTAVLDKLAA
ncbi:universal stress protein [Streptacidiphilus anmyonensis]|uniref:universal stress protein n=1 Tax=Streptacidiphilus anmyonensis TaxID=405782 RepID=UPI0005AAB424|nr:universal stress protein [Streptacidiphilus anmyonensis]